MQLSHTQRLKEENDCSASNAAIRNYNNVRTKRESNEDRKTPNRSRSEPENSARWKRKETRITKLPTITKITTSPSLLSFFFFVFFTIPKPIFPSRIPDFYQPVFVLPNSLAFLVFRIRFLSFLHTDTDTFPLRKIVHE